MSTTNIKLSELKSKPTGVSAILAELFGKPVSPKAKTTDSGSSSGTGTSRLPGTASGASSPSSSPLQQIKTPRVYFPVVLLIFCLVVILFLMMFKVKNDIQQSVFII
jgi:hypothetical protein